MRYENRKGGILTRRSGKIGGFTSRSKRGNLQLALSALSHVGQLFGATKGMPAVSRYVTVFWRGDFVDMVVVPSFRMACLSPQGQ